MQPVGRNGPVAGVLVAVAISIVAAAALSLRHGEAALLFTVVAAVSAWIVIQKVKSPILALGLLAGLALYASFPAKRLYGVGGAYGALGTLAVTVAFFVVLFLVGGGLRRRWTEPRR